MSILALVAAGLALWRIRLLSRRLSALEARLGSGPAVTADPDSPPDVSPWDEPTADAVPDSLSGSDAPAPPDSPPPAEPHATRKGHSAWNPGQTGGGALSWIQDNWIYPVAAGALILAGVFLVQYSIERGLLTPALRVILAAGLGTVLIVGGEGLRRRSDGGRALHLPATFAGAGVVVLHAAVLAALHLYAMIGAQLAFGLMLAVTVLALGLGWVHGALLAALGVLGGAAAPFLLGGSGPPDALYAYFAALAALGLGIDSHRRWGWVSWLALAAPTLGACMIWLGGAGDTGLAMVLLGLSAMAMALPGGALVPRATGAMCSTALIARGATGPDWPTAVSGAMTLAATMVLALAPLGWPGALALAALAGLHALWGRRAPALADQAVLPALGLVVWTWTAAVTGPGRDFVTPRGPLDATPTGASLLVLLAVLVGAAALWRAESEQRRANPVAAGLWTLGALALPGATVVMLDLRWTPAAVIGAYAWALHAMALAGVATALALRFARQDGGQGLRLGAATSAAFALIALGLFALLGQSALTLALAVLMIAAAAMMRRFGLPELGVFICAASIALSWRLVMDPGISWLVDDFRPDSATTLEVVLTLVAVVAGPAVALWLMPVAAGRWSGAARLFTETALSGHVAIAAAIVLVRVLPVAPGSHALLGLNATVLIALALVQLARAGLPFGRTWRRGLIWIYGAVAAVLLVLAVGPVSPLAGGFFSGTVRGPAVFNDLWPAYVVPGLLLAVRGGPRLRWIGAALIGYGAALILRHLWQGAGGMPMWRGIAEGELYAYTVALLVTGAGFVVQALRSGRPGPRRIGMALVALAAVKAFAVDVAGLGGLLRIFAFLGLGLALAGLAWLNRWAALRENR